MSYASDYSVGEKATAALARLVKAWYPGAWIESKEGTIVDKRDGQDYTMHLADGSERPGSHRHVRNDYRGYFCIRFSRANGTDTDYIKLFKKPDNYLYTFSWGNAGYVDIIEATTAGQLKQWIQKHETDLSDHLSDLYGDGNLFLMIPTNEIQHKPLSKNR